MRERRRILTIILIALVVIAGCGDDDDGSTSRSLDTSSDNSMHDDNSEDETVETDQSNGTADEEADDTTEETVTSPGDTKSERVERADLSEIFRDPERFVGKPIQVTARVFFEEQCPPEPEGPQRCTLTGYGTYPNATALAPGDDSIVLSDGKRWVSCVKEGGASACPGWEHGIVYELTGTVEHQVLGGRQVDDIELQVENKQG